MLSLMFCLYELWVWENILNRYVWYFQIKKAKPRLDTKDPTDERFLLRVKRKRERVKLIIS